MDTSLPVAPAGSSFLTQLRFIFQREFLGIILVLGYFAVLPAVMAITFFRNFYKHMGFIRYMLMTNLLLFMLALPIKMVLRWVYDLKYIIAIPEYFLNF
jgi:hypothetical protein